MFFLVVPQASVSAIKRATDLLHIRIPVSHNISTLKPAKCDDAIADESEYLKTPACM